MWKGTSVSLDPQLVEILACPDTHHTPLDYDPAAQTLTCPRCRRVFEVRDGIPILLLDEAREAPPSGETPPADATTTDREGV
jgi:uncharacterized protein YbaR (Trm112 family)